MSSLFQVCENCWHGRDHGGDFDGKCRRYPPKVIHPSTHDPDPRLPKVYAMEFCGEWHRVDVSPTEVGEQKRQYLAMKAAEPKEEAEAN